MHRINKMKAIIAIAVAMAFVTPVAVIANDEGSTNNSEIIPEIYSDDLCPSVCYDAEYRDVTLDTGVLGDRFYAYVAYDPGGVLPAGPAYFDSENPGSITSLAPTTSENFISGGTWAKGIWYGCEYTGNLWIINESDGTMTLIGSGGSGLNGLDYDRTTDTMYGASSNDLYTIDMNSGAQTYVGSFGVSPDGLMIAITFDGEGNLYGITLGTNNLYSINTSTGAPTLIGPLGITLNFAQDAAYDIDNDILYLSAYITSPVTQGHLCTCDVVTGACTIVGKFQSGAEITGFAIPYTPSQPPETPELPTGPNEGLIEVEYTFSTRTTDPEGGLVYYLWDWDDGNYSEWMGPFDSGDVVLACHTWTKAEIYEVRVKAKDFYIHESSWSDPKIINIIGIPALEIGNIGGGLFKVNAVVKNIGDAVATKINWSITLDGGFILSGEKTTGNILSLSAGSVVTISSDLILGFGKTVITVTVECAEGSSDTKTQDAFMLLFFII